MNETKLISSLLPGYPDFQRILKNVREKYDIPELSPEDDGLTEILLSDKQLDWDAVHQDIEDQIRAIPEILPPELFNIFQNYKSIENQPLNFLELETLPPEVKAQFIKLLNLPTSMFKSTVPYLDSFYKSLSDMIFEFLITGKTRNIPQSWFSQVQTIQLFGNPVVIAAAGQMADPKVVSEEFRREFNKTFGDKPRLSEENLNSAQYLRMKLENKPLKDILDVYILRHPCEFPNTKSKKAYARAKEKHREMLKKRIQRLLRTINVMGGDK